MPGRSMLRCMFDTLLVSASLVTGGKLIEDSLQEVELADIAYFRLADVLIQDGTF